MKAAGVDNDVLSFSFNQDRSRIAVGTNTGTLTYSCCPFELLSEKRGDDASIIAMHYNTDLVAHVGAGKAASSSQRCLRMVNTRKDKEITRRNYGGAILNVLVNGDRVVVVLETTIYIYDLRTMEHLHTIEEIPANPAGVCALPTMTTADSSDPSQTHNLLAYPNNSTKGFVHVYDVVGLRAGPVIEAHTSRIGCLAFNDNGTILATASTKGTVFRVFAMPGGDKLHEFRRSVATNATIFSMSFDIKSTLLCVSSDHPTIHVFKLSTPEPPTEEQGWSSYLSTTVASAASYLPTPVSEMLTQSRSFASITLKQFGNPNLCVVCGTAPNVHVLVATSEGILYKYRVDTDKGGECGYDGAFPLSPHSVDSAAAAAAAAPAADARAEAAPAPAPVSPPAPQ